LRKALVIIFSACSVIGLRAQDIHFSQYYLSPLSLNPANTGNYNGDYRFFGNYRSQWRDIDRAYNTFSAGGDMNFFPYNQNVSGGLIIINDRSGANLNVNKILPSGAFHKNLHLLKLHFGIQPGVVIKSVDFYKNSFPDQLNWQTGHFDPTLPNNETNVQQRFTYLDVNAGFGASRRFGNLEPEFGVSLFHINQPKESFLGRKPLLKMRQAFNAVVNYSVTPVVIVRAHTLYGYTSEVSDWVSGVNLEYVLSRNSFYANSVYAGMMWRSGFKRNPDAGIATVGINYQNYTVGFSFDVTSSRLKTAVNSKGAYELAFIYKAKSTHLTRRAVPCERY
jgi:type IX secretion system PorP/SprF family membrane protein